MPLPPAETMAELVDSNDIRNDAAEVRRRAQRDGYLFFRALLDREAVLAIRQQFVSILRQIGWLAAGTDDMDAIAGREPVWEGMPDYRAAFDRFQRLPAFHALAHDRAILDILDRLFGEPAFVHPRNIGRVMFPGTPTTPPHQDHLPIQGTPDTWTAWIVQGDVPRNMGGLAVLEASHNSGIFQARPMPGAGGRGIDIETLPGQWRTTDYHPGDVLMFHSFTVHASLPNRTENRMRLSCDYRYQAPSQPIHPKSLKPHMGWFDWEDVYQEWGPQWQSLKYYWKDLPLTVTAPAGPQATKGY